MAWGVTAGDDKPAAKPAAPASSSNIFDFGLEPLPNSEAEAGGKGDLPRPAARPAKEKPAEKPARAAEDPPAAARNAPGADGPPAPLSDGEVQEFLKSCHVDAQGVVTVDHLLTLALRGTDNQHFVASGDFWLAPEPTPFHNGQMYFHLRQSSGKKCIDLSVNGMRVKRMLLAGEMVKKFASPMKFSGIEPEKWHHFKINASKDGITVQFDGQQGIAKGPIETAGANSIVLGPGAKLKNVKVEIMAEGRAPAVVDETPVVVEEFYQHEDHLWFWHPRHCRYEMWADAPPAGYHVHDVKKKSLPAREEVIKRHEQEHFRPPEQRIHVELHRIQSKAVHGAAPKR
jgi:hypothetical protein